MDSDEHVPTPQDGTVYAWFSLPSDGHMPTDYPLVGHCVCGQRLVRDRISSPWRHREPGEEIDASAGDIF